jgi:hypothetical protein
MPAAGLSYISPRMLVGAGYVRSCRRSACKVWSVVEKDFCNTIHSMLTFRRRLISSTHVSDRRHATAARASRVGLRLSRPPM